MYEVDTRNLPLMVSRWLLWAAQILSRAPFYGALLSFYLWRVCAGLAHRFFHLTAASPAGQFLAAASNIVKPGGVVVYSVCTITFEECESAVDFAESELGLKQIDAEPFIGRRGLDPDTMSQRFDPVTDGCGYFIAKFVKT